MKTFPFVLAAGGLALVLAVPRFGPACRRSAPPPRTADAPGLAPDCLSAVPAWLNVEPGPATVADRGPLAGAVLPASLHGSYRYQQELEHRVLYVYDDVQDLLVRVVDPDAVRLLGGDR